MQLVIAECLADAPLHKRSDEFRCVHDSFKKLELTLKFNSEDKPGKRDVPILAFCTGRTKRFVSPVLCWGLDKFHEVL